MLFRSTEWNALYAVGSYIAANPFVAGCASTAAAYAWSGYALAKRGDRLAQAGLVRLVQLAQGDRLPREAAEAQAIYEKELEDRRPGATRGRLPVDVDLTTLGDRLKRGQACSKAERAYCEEAALWRGGAIGSQATVARFATKTQKPVPVEWAEGLYALRGTAARGLPDRAGPFRVAG